MFAGECWQTLCLLKNFNMQKLCRRLEINFGVSCASFVNVPESWFKLYRVRLSRTLLANVDWDAGGGELNLTERLSNGGQRLPDAMNAMVTQKASLGTATACSNDSVSVWPLLQSKQDCQEVSKVWLYIDDAWRGPQAYPRWVFVRLSWTKSATAAHTLLLRWQKFAYANRK